MKWLRGGSWSVHVEDGDNDYEVWAIPNVIDESGKGVAVPELGGPDGYRPVTFFERVDLWEAEVGRPSNFRRYELGEDVVRRFLVAAGDAVLLYPPDDEHGEVRFPWSADAPLIRALLEVLRLFGPVHPIPRLFFSRRYFGVANIALSERAVSLTRMFDDLRLLAGANADMQVPHPRERRALSDRLIRSRPRIPDDMEVIPKFMATRHADADDEEDGDTWSRDSSQLLMFDPVPRSLFALAWLYLADLLVRPVRRRCQLRRCRAVFTVPVNPAKRGRKPTFCSDHRDSQYYKAAARGH